MSFLTGALAPPSGSPLLGSLVAGFILLVVGLAALTARRPHLGPLASPEGTRRAVLYALVFALCSVAFWRVVSPALLGREQSPWLLALGDVIFVTLGLFAWVMALAEGYEWRDYGIRAPQPSRFVLTLLLGVGAAALYSFRGYLAVATERVRVTPDSLVFALVFAAIGSALPEELLFRGYLQGSLEGRTRRWAQVVIPALAFTVFRSLRFLPGVEQTPSEWVLYILRVALPLGLWWGLMRDLAGGSLWPCLISHFLLEFGTALASVSPPAS